MACPSSLGDRATHGKVGQNYYLYLYYKNLTKLFTFLYILWGCSCYNFESRARDSVTAKPPYELAVDFISVVEFVENFIFNHNIILFFYTEIHGNRSETEFLREFQRLFLYQWTRNWNIPGNLALVKSFLHQGIQVGIFGFLHFRNIVFWPHSASPLTDRADRLSFSQ